MTVDEIIEHRCGGWQELARKCPLRPPIAAKSVYSWLENGIPEKHWHWVKPLAGVSEAELHQANENLRRESRRPLARRRRADLRPAA